MTSKMHPLAALGRIIAAVAKLKVGDRVAFKPDGWHYRRGARTGAITAIEATADACKRLAARYNTTPEALMRALREQGISGAICTIRLPVVRLDPAPGLEVIGFEFVTDPDKFDVLPVEAGRPTSN